MMCKHGAYVRFKIKEKENKIKSPYVTYEHFESILVPEENGKQNTGESYTNKISETCCLQLWL